MARSYSERREGLLGAFLSRLCLACSRRSLGRNRFAKEHSPGKRFETNLKPATPPSWQTS